jgi:hypothetical protein
VYVKSIDSESEGKDDDTSGDKKITCETATLEVRLRSEGIVVTGLDQHGGVSVVQDLKNSRVHSNGTLPSWHTFSSLKAFY